MNLESQQLLTISERIGKIVMVNPNQRKGKDSQNAFAFNKVSNIVGSQSIVAFSMVLVLMKVKKEFKLTSWLSTCHHTYTLELLKMFESITSWQCYNDFFFFLVEEVFMDTQTLIHLILDGNNVCIFVIHKLLTICHLCYSNGCYNL